MNKPRRYQCIICRRAWAHWALQDLFTNRGEPVNGRTVQIKGRPEICTDCLVANLRFAERFDDYQECAERVVSVMSAYKRGDRLPTIALHCKRYGDACRNHVVICTREEWGKRVYFCRSCNFRRVVFGRSEL